MNFLKPLQTVTMCIPHVHIQTVHKQKYTQAYTTRISVITRSSVQKDKCCQQHWDHSNRIIWKITAQWWVLFSCRAIQFLAGFMETKISYKEACSDLSVLTLPLILHTTVFEILSKAERTSKSPKKIMNQLSVQACSISVCFVENPVAWTKILVANQDYILFQAIQRLVPRKHYICTRTKLQTLSG